MSEQLLPCPFCGATADFEANIVWWVRCTECFGEAESSETIAGAAANWNRRAVPPSIRDFLGKVQGVCMGVAMSDHDHPDPGGALLALFNEAQAILFPTAAPERVGTD